MSSNCVCNKTVQLAIQLKQKTGIPIESSDAWIYTEIDTFDSKCFCFRIDSCVKRSIIAGYTHLGVPVCIFISNRNTQKVATLSAGLLLEGTTSPFTCLTCTAALWMPAGLTSCTVVCGAFQFTEHTEVGVCGNTMRCCSNNTNRGVDHSAGRWFAAADWRWGVKRCC